MTNQLIKRTLTVKKMKFTTALLAAFILAIGFGSTPVAATGTAIAPSVFDILLVGVNKLLENLLEALFSVINKLLLLLFESLLGLITKLADGSTRIALAKLLPLLLALKSPTLAKVAAALFKLLGKNGAPILALIPPCIGATPIDLDTLLEVAASLLDGDSITLSNLIRALAKYLVTYQYSIKLPKC